MYLKRLELAGFKSFPSKTTLEFPPGVTAIVGPNGSGKSNVADALRWVLGEQSMKFLRSKKGEDLIFNGTPERAKVGKASVDLVIDNQGKVFPVDFGEVTISRKIYRDGTNQYYLNGSEVRLKDIAELIAAAKLGLKGYAIINQGMGDLILNAAATERREIIEEALGLREFQLKKKDALGKLSETTANLVRAQDLLRELDPHLKFLKRQVVKLEKRDELLEKIASISEEYFCFQMSKLSRSQEDLKEKEGATNQALREAEKAFRELEGKLASEEQKLTQLFAGFGDATDAMRKFQEERAAVVRELGKLEGLLEAPLAEKERLDLFYLRSQIQNVLVLLNTSRGADADLLRSAVAQAIKRLESLIAEMEKGKTSARDDAGRKELQKNYETLNLKLKAIDKKITDLNASLAVPSSAQPDSHEQLAALYQKIRQNERELDRLKFQLKEFDSARHQLLIAEGELKQFFGPAFDKLLATWRTRARDSKEDGFGSGKEVGDLRRQIERLRAQVELVAEIDPETEREFTQTNERYEFLNRESHDLQVSMGDLQKVIAELDSTIAKKFMEAFGKISSNFDHYFRLLFGGGKAQLSVQKNLTSSQAGERGELTKEEDIVGGGIEVHVSLPGKKVKGLDLLSGGERSLTSIALLFALVATSPPPFLVLDEIDAALDESNSLRFVKILQELKAKAQFILITHNRVVMQEADVLYGITMEQEGISKLLSLRFEEAQKVAA